MTDTTGARHTSKKLVSLIQHAKPLEPSQLGWVVAELIKREQKPGGPYLISTDSLGNIRFTKQVKEFIHRQTHIQEAEVTLNKHQTIQLRTRYTAAAAYLNELPLSLSENLLPTLHRLRASDTTGEIGLLSTLFYESYFNNLRRNNIAQLARRLDTVNILTWVSYTIYDEAVDNPTIQAVKNIPAANALLRIIESILVETGNPKLANSLLNDVDLAMTDESNRNSNPTITDLSVLQNAMGKKSIAHIAGPLSLLNLLAPIHLDSVRSALEKYCTARQLLDDIYDWRDDMANKQVTYATVIIGKCATLAEQHAAKRGLTEEAMLIAGRALEELNAAFGIAKSPFASATLEKIITTTKRALDSDAAVHQSIAGYSAAYQDLET